MKTHFLEITPATECLQKRTHGLEMPIRKGKEKGVFVHSLNYRGSSVGVLKDS